MLLHPVVGFFMPVVPQCTSQHQQPSARIRFAGHGSLLGCEFYSHTHHVTHAVTELLQCGVTRNFCSLSYVTNCVFSDSFVVCDIHHLIVLVIRKGQIMKVWAQITTTKSIRKSTGSSKSIVDTFCKSIGIDIANSFIRKYRYRR